MDKFDSPGFIHWSPFNIVVDVLSPLQPFSQHGSGVVHIVICCCPETQTTQGENGTLSRGNMQLQEI